MLILANHLCWAKWQRHCTALRHLVAMRDIKALGWEVITGVSVVSFLLAWWSYWFTSHAQVRLRNIPPQHGWIVWSVDFPYASKEILHFHCTLKIPNTPNRPSWVSNLKPLDPTGPYNQYMWTFRDSTSTIQHANSSWTVNLSDSNNLVDISSPSLPGGCLSLACCCSWHCRGVMTFMGSTQLICWIKGAAT